MSIKPSRLNKGDRIGIIAPAGPVEPHELEPSLTLLEGLGYVTVEAEHLYDRKGYLAGDDHDRLSDLHSMFERRDIRAVFCARGGYGTLRLIDRVDYGLIAANPKIVVGYSDITALLLAIYRRTGLILFHGPVVKGLADSSSDNLKNLMDHISTGKVEHADLSRGRVLRGGSAEGILMGGNLCLVSSLTGTPFMPSPDKTILFIEETGEFSYRIDRMLAHLKLSGMTENMSALIAGSFIDCGDVQDIDSLLLEWTADSGIPVISGIPLGHGPENITLPVGVNARFDTSELLLKYRDGYIE